MQHIPVRAGSAVFWDNRIPHGNAYRNDPRPIDDNHVQEIVVAGNGCDNGCKGISALPLGTSGARAVVYCSFLPDVDVNRSFVARQLEDWKVQRPPRVGDRWIAPKMDKEGLFGTSCKTRNNLTTDDTAETLELSELGKRLLGLVEWP